MIMRRAPFARFHGPRFCGFGPLTLILSLVSGWLLFRPRADGTPRRRSGLWTFLLILLLIRPFFFR